MSRATDVAWAAGLFEGEGSINLTRPRSGPRQPQLALTTTDCDVSARFAAIVGCGRVTIYDPPNQKWKRQYRWRVCGWDDCTRVIELFRRHLGKRRLGRVAEFESERDRKRQGQGTPTHCKRGHPINGENTYIAKQSGNNGVHRVCRVCRRERRRVKHA